MKDIAINKAIAKPTSIRDNRQRGSVGNFLKKNIESNSKLSIVSAFFTIYAYQKLKNELDSIDHLNFLFGEPTFIKSVDPNTTKAKEYMIDDGKLVIPIKKRLQQKAVSKECAQWIREKVNIKSMVEPDFLHGKMYHIKNQNGVQKAVVGSSNFTVKGLGLNENSNIELNMLVTDDRDRADLINWFDELWNDTTGNLVRDVKANVLNYVEELYKENSPEFIYYKTLFHIFNDYLDEQNRSGFLHENIGFFDTKIWNMLYSFQKDAVKSSVNKINEHGGCIIADSVGLGKTFEALAVIKYFSLLNYRVLVLCPKKLRDNWTIYQAQNNSVLNPLLDDKFNYTVLSHTDLSRDVGKTGDIDLSIFNWSNFDLIVIDESHNFRNNAPGKDDKDGNFKPSRYFKLMEDVIKKGIKTKVLLLSATPVNNNLKDLRNQLYFISADKDGAFQETIGISSLSQTIKNAQKIFTKWADPKRGKARNVKKLLEQLDSSFFRMLDKLTIARSRKHIVNYYKEEMKIIGDFPKRLPVISKAPAIDIKNEFPSYDKINQEMSGYKLTLFNPDFFVYEKFKDHYEDKAGKKIKAFSQKDREDHLIGMIKVNFLKRLESSIKSFELSLERTIKKISDLEINIREYLKNPDKESLFETSYDIDIEDDELTEANSVGKKLKYSFKHLKLDEWLLALKKDKDALVMLKNSAKNVTPDRDEKLWVLKKLIKNKIETPLNDSNKKIIIFTAFSDTAEYLYDCLVDFAKNELNINIALVTGSGSNKTTFGKKEYNNILTNFSPGSKNRDKILSMHQNEQIDLLIATDCISEGQNLQDCDYLINYDIHWNPVRIIQRFGRIDRLGSKNKVIQLVNFWPTDDLNNYIKLKDRVESRMALVDITATGEENILEPEKLKGLIEEDLKFRNRQLKKMKTEILDLEDMEENISLSEFTLDDFRIDLSNFIDKNKEKLEKAPLGLYAVVPSPDNIEFNKKSFKEIKKNMKELIRPGVIFCFQQIDAGAENKTINPLNPYFLVYVRDDKTVRYNYTQSKQVLEIYRLLCNGKTQAHERLCDIFNKKVDNGKDMSFYNELLGQSMSAIKRVFKKKAGAVMTNNRQALLIPVKKDNKKDIFKLVTWLVIR